MPARTSRALEMRDSNKAKQGCWTCKKRKIGCDKQLPECNNCLRTGRKCLGYGVRLVWPDRYDGRRKDLDFAFCDPSEYLPVVNPHYGKHFININYDDLTLARNGLSGRDLIARSPINPSRGLSLHPLMIDQDASCMSYYEQQISPMISTLHIRNGFRTALLPMAMSSSDASASALCQAMMAVSAYHRFGPQGALSYKMNAVRSLRDSLGSSVDGHGQIALTETQVAASMMLCVYNVFDETEGNWHMHLDGAKRMLQRLPISADLKKDPASAFLLTWFLYHEILGGFTQPLRRDSYGPDFMRQLLDFGPTTSYIVGSLGCSVDILAVIHEINQLRPVGKGKKATRSASEIALKRFELESKLQNLAQLMDPEEESSESSPRRQAILATAELYRLATILYLLRVCPADGDDLAHPAYMKQAFQVLRELEVATSPWPIFIIACESDTDEQRMEILQTLDRMDDVRKIGNIYTMRSIIETYWKNRDLNFDPTASANHRGNWLSLVNCDTAVPWFI